MSRILRFKRYPESSLSNIIGADGELIVDTTNQTITVHDGVTPGGTRLTTENFENQIYNSTTGIISCNGITTPQSNITFSIDSGTIFKIQEDVPGTPEIAFFGTEPVMRQNTAVQSSVYVSGSTAGTFQIDDTYGGYTIGQIVTALKAYGLLE